MPTEETWVWMENENYTVVELPLGEEDIYRLDSLGGLRDNGYTFTHSGSGRAAVWEEEAGRRAIQVIIRAYWPADTLAIGGLAARTLAA